MKTFIRVCLVLAFTLISGITFAKMEFPLPQGYFVKAKMPMHVVYPRPDSETQVHARHRWAHSGMEYQIPIGVQGGAWPFKYEITSGPAGAKVGSLYGDDNYGVITWTPASSTGTAEFAVKITDQELNVISANWKVTIDPSKFVFIQSGWTGNKQGTITEPLATFNDWFKSSQADSTYLNKIAVFRGGTYQLIGDPAYNNNIRLLEKSKTPSLIGFPGETPIFDASKAKILTDDTRLHDLFVAGITWTNARQDVANAHYWWAVGDVTRATWWRNTFQNIGQGQVGNDNTGPVFVAKATVLKTNILYKENNHINVQNMGGGNGTYFTIYGTSYALIEQNMAKNSNTGTGWYAKGTVANVTIRANVAFENVDGGQIGVGYGAEAGQVPHDHEVCWNRIGVRIGTSYSPLIWSLSDYYAGQTYNSYVYRNTFENGSAWIRFKGNEPFEVDANVVITDNMRRWDTASMLTVIPNLVGGATSGILLQGKVVGELFGKVGHSVAVGAGPEQVPNAKYKTTPVAP